LDLGTRTFKVAVVVEQLQPPDDLLRAAANKGDDLMRTQKTMPVDKPDDGTVAFGQLNRGNRVNAPKTGWLFLFHSATMAGMREVGETAEFASGASAITNFFRNFPGNRIFLM